MQSQRLAKGMRKPRKRRSGEIKITGKKSCCSYRALLNADVIFNNDSSQSVSKSLSPFHRCQLIFPTSQLASFFRNFFFRAHPDVPWLFSVFPGLSRFSGRLTTPISPRRITVARLGSLSAASVHADYCLYNTIHLTKSLMPIHSLDLREPMLLKFNIRRGRAAVTIDYSVVCWKQKMFAGEMELKVSGGSVQFPRNFRQPHPSFRCTLGAL